MDLKNGRIKAALFDLDETLVSTQRAHFCSYQEACKSFGLNLELERFQNFIGWDSRSFLKEIFPNITIDQISNIRKAKSSIFYKYVHLTHINVKVLDLALKLSESAKLGIVTNAKRINCQEILKYHGIENIFSAIVDGEMVENPKPSSESYEKALSLLKVKADETISFEDSEAGISASMGAGIQTFRVLWP